MFPFSHMRLAWLVGMVAVAAAAMSPSVRAQTAIAEFNNDFTASGVAPGWSFLWNANGPIGSGAVGFPNNYVPLQRDAAGNYVAPGTSIAICPAADANSVPSIYPGLGSTQDPAHIMRYAIVAYTVSAADVAAYGGGMQMFPYQFRVIDTSITQTSDGVDPAVYANATRIFSYHFVPGFVYDSSASNAYPASLGLLRPGDTIYVATGSHGDNTGDRLDMDFTLTLSSTFKVLAPTGKLLYGPNIAATINSGGLDLANHDAVYSYGDGEQATAYDQVRQWILQGRASQGGIYTSSLTVPGTTYPALIVPVDNHELHLTDFDGASVTSQGVYNQILLKYTRVGDTNLDGMVTDADLVNIIAHMGQPGSYLDGDVDLDGMVDMRDYNVVTSILAQGSAPQYVATPQVVLPEPGSFVLIALTLLPGCRARRRHRRR